MQEKQMNHSNIGVILVNLGTPDEPTPKAIRRYLKEFLSDPRVIDLPRWPWWFLLHTLILPFRPHKLVHAYQQIWMAEGSPLKVFGERLKLKLAANLAAEYGQSIPVVHALSYGTPNLRSALLDLRQKNVKQLIVLPLYPQFSTTTTGTVFDQLVRLLGRCPVIPEFHLIHDYYQHPAYIKAIADAIQAHWQQQGRGELLLFSFHGLPKRYVEKGDPYIEQCKATAALVAERLALAPKDWQVTFQSRFGKAEWVKPYTLSVVQNLPAQGIKRLDIISPGFAVDCLETLEELAIQNRAAFLDAGGEGFHYIPALNDTDSHVELLQALLKKIIHQYHE